MLGMGGDEDLFTVERRVVDVIFDMGEHGLTHREIRRCFEVEQARQHAAVAAGVQDEIGFDAVLAAIFAAHIELWFRLIEIDADNRIAITDFRTLQCCLIGQQLVEIGALHLERGRLAGGESVAKIEGAVALAPGKRRAGLALEPGGVDGVEHAGFFNEVQAVAEQAFADGEAWEVLALEHQHIVALALEQGSGDSTGRAGTDDHDLTGFHFNDWHVSSGAEDCSDSGARDAGRSGPAAASRSGPSASARNTAPG